jgi:hypothetical protein
VTDIDRVFAVLDRSSETDLIELSSLWTGGDADVRKAAWSKVTAIAQTDSRQQQLKEARDRLASWVNDLGITWAGAYDRSIVVPMGVDQGNLRRNAVPPILDAIAAILFADALDEDERDELSAPFESVTASD